MKLQWKCEVCKETFENSNFLYSHIKKQHNMIAKEYYDAYLKKPDEGTCANCGKPTRLLNNTLGYLKCCGTTCQYELAKNKPRKGKRYLEKERKKKEGKYKCEICGNRTDYLGIHITQAHKMDCKDYYDKYLRKPGEGICPTCGKETKFRGITKGGYLTHCSYSCAQNDKEVWKKKEETSMREHGVLHYRNSEKARKTLAKHLADGTVKPQEEICQSKAETELIDYIKAFYNKEIVHSDRTVLDGYELDIWLPDIRVGVEFDGEFWHADPHRFKATDIVTKGITAQEIWDKDKRKDILCESKGVHLMRVKEYDYAHKKTDVLEDLYKYIIKYD